MTSRGVRLGLCAGVLFAAAGARLAGQGDLDQFMQRVVSRRDDNWKKLQQYILDERESIEVRGPSGASVWGEEREYTWFIRDGFFVRSPVRANGVALSDADRRKYEDEFVARERERDRRAAQGRGDAAPPPPEDPPTDLGGLIQQTRAPRFVSSAYFLRFQFDEGTYALVGRETLEGRNVYRIEYYPSNLFPENRRGPGRLGRNPVDEETRHLLNKVAVVTMWIDPASTQILKYTFHNIALDFLPAQWLVRVNDASATMTMAEAFPDVWLPRGIEMNVGLGLAVGEFALKYQLAYHDYRRADVSTTLRVPSQP